MPKTDNMTAGDLRTRFPDFDTAWGALYETLWDLSFLMESSGLFSPDVHKQVDDLFDALDGILLRHDESTAMLEDAESIVVAGLVLSEREQKMWEFMSKSGMTTSEIVDSIHKTREEQQ